MEDRKKKILDSAIEIIFKKGYEQTSMEDISQATKIPLATLYRICKSKEHILFMIYETFWGISVSEIAGVINSPYDVDAINKLKAIITVAQNIMAREGKMTNIIATTYLPPVEKIKDDEELKNRRLSIRNKNREMLQLIDSVIIEGQKSNQITSELKPQVIRQILIGAFQTLAYGLFIQFIKRESVYYSRIDANAGIDYVLTSFTIKQCG